MKKNFSRYLLVALVVIFLVSRFIVLINLLDGVYKAESLVQGRLGRDLMDGLPLPGNLLDYRLTCWLGGDFINALLLVPFLMVFKGSYFGFSLMFMLLTATILGLIFLFLKRNFGYLAALLGSLLFIFAPALPVLEQLSCTGVHSNITFFNILLMLLFYRIFFEKKPISKKIFISMGLISGLGVFYDYTFLITLVICFIFWFILDKGFILRKRFWIFSISFIVGFLPWIIYNLHADFASLRMHGKSLIGSFEKGIADFMHTFWVSITEILKRILQVDPLPGCHFYRFISSNYAIAAISKDLLYYLFIVCFCLFLVRTIILIIKKETFSSLRYLFIVSLILLYLTAFSLYRQQMDYYLMSLLPLIYFVIAIEISRIIRFIWTRSKFFIGEAVSFMLIILILFICLSNYLSYVTPFSLQCVNKNIFKYQGYGTRFIRPGNVREKIAKRSFVSEDYFMLEPLCILPPEDNPYVKAATVFWDGLASRGILFAKEDIKTYVKYIKGVERKSLQSYFYVLLGIAIGKRFSGDLDFSRSLIESNIPEEFQAACYEGLTIAFMDVPFCDISHRFKEVDKIPPNFRHFFYILLGERIGSRFGKFGLEKVDRFVINLDLDEQYTAYLYQGIFACLSADNTEFMGLGEGCKVAYHKYFYQAIGKNMLATKGDLNEKITGLTESEQFVRILSMEAEKDRPFFFQGIFARLLLDSEFAWQHSPNCFFKPGGQDNIIGVITKYLEHEEMYRSDFYKGVGFEVSLRSFGYIREYERLLSFIEKGQASRDFYYGYGLGLAARYGRDLEATKQLIEDNVPEDYRALSYRGFYDG